MSETTLEALAREVAALRSRVQELGLAGRVELVGEVEPERLATWYAACWVTTTATIDTPAHQLSPEVLGRLEPLVDGQRLVDIHHAVGALEHRIRIES